MTSRLTSESRTGDSPTLLGRATDAGDPSLEALLEEQCVRSQRGEPLSAAVYLARNPILRADSKKAAALIYQEFAPREQRGDVVDFSDYMRDFPSTRPSWAC